MKARPEANAPGTPGPGRRIPGAAFLAALLLSVPLASPAAETADIEYQLQLTPGEPGAAARIRVAQGVAVVEEIEFRGEGEFLTGVRADGKLRRTGDRLIWQPPARGGQLRYQVLIDRRRDNGAQDAMVTPGLAIFRAEDGFPVSRFRWADGTRIQSELLVQAPKDWSVVLPYRRNRAGRYPVANHGTGSRRPVGWILAGELGTRRERIRGVDFAVSAPKGLRVERLGTIAMLRWNLPDLLRGFEARPELISIVMAGDPMWRGALSAPNSIYLHSDRPLISENGTSPVLHEVVHVLLTGLKTARDEDWIDEGLAEYLSTRTLARTGTISKVRFQATLAEFRRRGAGVKTLRGANARGPVTARAVVIFHNLDEELRAASAGKQELVDLLRQLLAEGGSVDVNRLRAAAASQLGRPARSLAPEQLPGLDR